MQISPRVTVHMNIFGLFWLDHVAPSYKQNYNTNNHKWLLGSWHVKMNLIFEKQKCFQKLFD